MKANEVIRERRIALGKTMKEVADLVGVSEGTVSRWESGEIANMRRNKIERLADVLMISPAVIMGWEDSPTPEQTPVPNPDQLSSDEKTLVTNYRILDSTDRMKAQGYIEGLALDEKYQKKKREGTA